MQIEDTDSTIKNKEANNKEIYINEQKNMGDRNDLVAELFHHHRNTHMAAHFSLFLHLAWHGASSSGRIAIMDNWLRKWVNAGQWMRCLAKGKKSQDEGKNDDRVYMIIADDLSSVFDINYWSLDTDNN